mmetsp:Transcript_3118/g.7039  ORF Transcript_3118/g.7039 Transcript_3118/m.7039 type:complete len:238 (-) Transcript_3118:81-794(-)
MQVYCAQFPLNLLTFPMRRVAARRRPPTASTSSSKSSSRRFCSSSSSLMVSATFLVPATARSRSARSSSCSCIMVCCSLSTPRSSSGAVASDSVPLICVTLLTFTPCSSDVVLSASAPPAALFGFLASIPVSCSLRVRSIATSSVRRAISRSMTSGPVAAVRSKISSLDANVASLRRADAARRGAADASLLDPDDMDAWALFKSVLRSVIREVISSMSAFEASYWDAQDIDKQSNVS